MTNFIPGKVVKTFLAKEGNKTIVRYPKWEDLNLLTCYINKLSEEDTFINLSGEKITKEEEAKFLADLFVSMEFLSKVFLCCFVKEKLVAICSIVRNERARKRGKHAGLFAITIAKEYRGQGIGYQLAKITIKEAKQKMTGLKIITLNVFHKNKIAQKLYEKLGFKQVGRIPKAILYKNKYIDKIIMYLKL